MHRATRSRMPRGFFEYDGGAVPAGLLVRRRRRSTHCVHLPRRVCRIREPVGVRGHCVGDYSCRGLARCRECDSEHFQRPLWHHRGRQRDHNLCWRTPRVPCARSRRCDRRSGHSRGQRRFHLCKRCWHGGFFRPARRRRPRCSGGYRRHRRRSWHLWRAPRPNVGRRNEHARGHGRGRLR